MFNNNKIFEQLHSTRNHSCLRGKHFPKNELYLPKHARAPTFPHGTTVTHGGHFANAEARTYGSTQSNALPGTLKPDLLLAECSRAGRTFQIERIFFASRFTCGLRTVQEAADSVLCVNFDRAQDLSAL